MGPAQNFDHGDAPPMGAEVSQGQLETTPLRACFAVIAGSALGAVLVIATLFGHLMLGALSGMRVDVPNIAEIFWALVYGSVLFLVGLTVLAGPLWFLLHRAGRRSWVDAALLGMLLGFLVSLAGYMSPALFVDGTSSFGDAGGPLLEDNVVTPHGWRVFLGYSAIYAIVCGLVGFAIWKMAYRARG
jgi:hypothetical protein